LVVRGAFPNLKDPLTPDELAGLACEPYVDSRLVIERGGRKPWQVIRGPQNPRALRRLPRTHWTLLVESVDRHSRAIAELALAFSFLPAWRMDDVMVSLAPLHGTVGAHVDSYDVFLIQGQGRRRWEVDRRAAADYKPGLDLRILKRFQVEDSWVLEPGDMLYVPPGVGHRGVTVPGNAEIALTYSIGFRAPTAADLLSTLLSRILAREAPRLFSDPGRTPARDAHEIAGPDLTSLRRFLISELESQDPDQWILALGEAVTAGGSARPSGRNAVNALRRRLADGHTVAQVPGARLAWALLARGRAALFVNGESRVFSRAEAFAPGFLCGASSRSVARRMAASETLSSVLADLLRAGVIAWRD
jgi:50S ribosomal protein L16 3-hydroxylase